MDLKQTSKRHLRVSDRGSCRAGVSEENTGLRVKQHDSDQGPLTIVILLSLLVLSIVGAFWTLWEVSTGFYRLPLSVDAH